MSYFIVIWELERLRGTRLYVSEPQSSLRTTILLDKWSYSCSPLHHHQLTALLSHWISQKSQSSESLLSMKGVRREDNLLSQSWYFPFITRIKELWEMHKVNADKWFCFFFSFYLASILIKTFCHVCWASSKCCNAAAMGMQKSCSVQGKKMFSSFTKSTTVITTRINQIYSRQTQGIIFFCACGHKRVYFCCNVIKFCIFRKSDGVFW